jgi:hypothetical protein
MRVAFLAPFVLFSSLMAQGTLPSEPPAKPRIPPSREVVRVSEDIRILKEDTLPWDLASNADPDNWTDSSGASSTQSEVLMGPAGATVALENTGAIAQDSLEAGKTWGLRLYAFTLKPKEKIAFSCKGFPPGKIVMLFSLPKKTGEMFTKIKNINRIQFSLERSRIELQNVLAEPFTCVLRLNGCSGYPYTLEIVRS